MAETIITKNFQNKLNTLILQMVGEEKMEEDLDFFLDDNAS